MAEAGKPLSIKDAQEISEAVKRRQENFPEEELGFTLTLILLNIGDRYAAVACMNEAHGWTGIKKDIPKGEGIPTCPEGHVLMQTGGFTLGWMSTTREG
jgi:hypothetical protein